MKGLHTLSWILLIIGGLNWLLVGAIQWDIGMLLGGQGEMLTRVIYVLIGLAAVYELLTHKSNCKSCC